MNLTNNDRLELRYPADKKTYLKQYCEANNIDMTAFVSEAIDSELLKRTGGQKTKEMIFANQIYNLIIAYPRLNKDFKESILKEIEKYGQHSNY